MAYIEERPDAGLHRLAHDADRVDDAGVRGEEKKERAIEEGVGEQCWTAHEMGEIDEVVAVVEEGREEVAVRGLCYHDCVDRGGEKRETLEVLLEGFLLVMSVRVHQDEEWQTTYFVFRLDGILGLSWESAGV